MEKEKIYKYVDHTVLKAVSSWQEIKTLCEQSLEYNTASVCVPPSYVKKIADQFSQVNICTVIGFPLGYNTKEVKVFESKQAIADGANEVDIVVNLGDVKNGDFDKITDELTAVKRAVGEKCLKVIIETCYLTQEEKIKLCQCVTNSGADYIKTSTGFGTNGATMEDVILFKKHIGKNVKIKAAGGIKTKQDMENFIDAGCDRLGTSSAIKILEDNNQPVQY